MRRLIFFFVEIGIRNIGSAKYKLYTSFGSRKFDWVWIDDNLIRR